MPKLSMYGLNKCTTCQKARSELEAAGWEVRFRDVRDQPLSEDERAELISDFGEKLVNRASLTWRGLDEAERALPQSDLIGKYPAVMKRPAIIADGAHYLGWTANVKRGLGLA